MRDNLITINMDWTEIKTNDKMNQTVKECLEMRKDNISLYARKRIDDLESEVKKLSKAYVSVERVDKMMRELSKETWIAVQGDDRGWKEWWADRNKLNVNDR